MSEINLIAVKSFDYSKILGAKFCCQVRLLTSFPKQIVNFKSTGMGLTDSLELVKI